MHSRLTARFVALLAPPWQPVRPGPDTEVTPRLEEKLDEFCRLPADNAANRLKRAKLVLAAVAGDGYRSVENYSRYSEVKDDANRIIGRLNAAYAQIKVADQHQSGGLFPVYRADLIVELSEAAGAAVAPTVRAAKRWLLAASSVERMATARSALVGLLEDELYLSAYRQACADFAGIEVGALDERISARCGKLKLMAGSGAIDCTMP